MNKKESGTVLHNPINHEYEAEIRTLRNQCVTLTEENERLREVLDACLLMCDFSSIPAIEKNVREALKKGE